MKIINDFIRNIKVKNELKNELKILYTQLYHLNTSSLCEYSEYAEPRMLHYDFTSNSFYNELFPTYILNELKKTNVDVDTELRIAGTKFKEIWDKHVEKCEKWEKKSQLKNSFYEHYASRLNDDDKEFAFDISDVSRKFSRIQFECAFSIRASVEERIFAIEIFFECYENY
jgi:hypothetical protein